MKKCHVFIVLILFFSESLASKEIIRLTNGEWPPYTSASLYQNGFASHVVREAFRAVDVEVVFGFFPWKRSYIYAQKGKGIDGEAWNGSIVWVKTDERENQFLYTDRVILDKEVLFFSKDNPLRWEKVSDLKGKIIGGTMHTAYPMFEEAEKQRVLSIERAGNYDTLFKRLVRGRIDAVPQALNVGNYFLRTSLTPKERSKVSFSPTIIQEEAYHVILSKKDKVNKRFVRLFNIGLNKIKLNGKYKELEEAFIEGVYDKPVDR